MKKFIFRKSLFLLKTQVGTRVRESTTLIIFNSSKYLLFKKYCLFLWFTMQFRISDFILLVFPLFFKFFSWFKYTNAHFLFLKYSYVKNYNFLFSTSKTFFWNFYNYNFFLFWWIHDISTFFLIPNLFRFNIKFLVWQDQFLKNFLVFFTATWSDFISNSFLLNTFFHQMNLLTDFLIKKNYLYQKFEILTNKLVFLINSPDLLLYNLQLLGNLKQKFSFDFFVFTLRKNTKPVYSSYIAYQSFLNTSLYLSRSFIFASNVTSSSLNVLLLKNFNKIFFRVGDKKKNFYLIEYLFWSRQTILFRKGYPYLTLHAGPSRENFMFLPIYFKLNGYNLNWTLHINFNKYDEAMNKNFNLKLCFKQFNNFFNIF